jgi:fido (protein-threonine AMPylation protein)
MRKVQSKLNWDGVVDEQDYPFVMPLKIDQNIELVLSTIFDSFELSLSMVARSIFREIIQNGLNHSNLKKLHSSIWFGPTELSGVYRLIVVQCGEKNFTKLNEIESEMDCLLSRDLSSPSYILGFLIEAIGRIHPFLDLNRRTLFLAADALMIRAGFHPVNWCQNRQIWEESRVSSDMFDPEKRLEKLKQMLTAKTRQPLECVKLFRTP